MIRKIIVGLIILISLGVTIPLQIAVDNSSGVILLGTLISADSSYVHVKGPVGLPYSRVFKIIESDNGSEVVLNWSKQLKELDLRPNDLIVSFSTKLPGVALITTTSGRGWWVHSTVVR